MAVCAYHLTGIMVQNIQTKLSYLAVDTGNLFHSTASYVVEKRLVNIGVFAFWKGSSGRTSPVVRIREGCIVQAGEEVIPAVMYNITLLVIGVEDIVIR